MACGFCNQCNVPRNHWPGKLALLHYYTILILWRICRKAHIVYLWIANGFLFAMLGALVICVSGQQRGSKSDAETGLQISWVGNHHPEQVWDWRGNHFEICAAHWTMVQLTVGMFVNHTPPTTAKMPNGSARGGTVGTANGTSTLTRQLQPKTGNSQHEHGSCSSTSSYPVFSEGQSDPDEEPLLRSPSSFSSYSVQRSLPSFQSSVPNIRDSSLQSSSSSHQITSPSPHSASSSEDDSSWDTNSWSSGATCLLRSSIKKHSEEAFQARLGSSSQSSHEDGIDVSCTQSECQEGSEWALRRSDSLQSLSSSQGIPATSTQLDRKIEEKLKFSQFLDEVTCSVMAPGSLEAFGIPWQKDPDSLWDESPCTYIREPRRSSVVDTVYQWTKSLPSCKILDASNIMRKSQEEQDSEEAGTGRAYLETDIDSVGMDDELESNILWETKKENLKKRHITPESMRSPTSLLNWSKDLPKYAYMSTSLPRSMNSLVSIVPCYM